MTIFLIIFILLIVILQIRKGDDFHHGGSTTKCEPRSPKPNIKPKPWPKNK